MIERVLGTRLERATDDHCTRTLVISDLHVTSVADPVVDRLAAVCDSARQGGRTRLFVLGDLFDAWVGDRQLRSEAGAAVARLLAETAAAGVPVTVLHGNRDYLLGPRFAREAGCRVVAGGLRFGAAGRRCVALHGDELCLADLGYQRAKRILRHPLTRAAVRSLPLPLALRLAGRARVASRRHTREMVAEHLLPAAAALAQVGAAEADLVVFGHVHFAARGRAAGGDGGIEYCVLPAFEADGVHLELEPGGVRYRAVDGQALPDPPPRAFP